MRIAWTTIGLASLWLFVACGEGSLSTSGDIIDRDGPVDWTGDGAGDEAWDVDPDAPTPDGEADVADLPEPDGDATPDGDGLDPDTQACAPPYAGWECPCESDEDCASGLCMSGPEGKVCSKICDPAAQEVDEVVCPGGGWTCGVLPDTCPDCLYVCTYAFADLCRPCRQHEQCAVGGDQTLGRCVDYGNAGSFCAVTCNEADGDMCPEGYACQAWTDPSAGNVIDLCVRVEGLCPCSESAISAGADTDCVNENQAGVCEGTRACTPEGLSECRASIAKAEICNGEDDDCDGAVDEGIAAGNCLVQNEWGACPGVRVCEAGALLCQGIAPEKEACNGKDDDCDGSTDEGFPDLDGDYQANCVDEDDDGDGVPDDGDWSGTVGDNPCDPGQSANCDDNCPAKPNPDQADLDGDGKGNVCDKDADADGHLGTKDNGDDCDDLNSAVHPGIVEGQVGEHDCRWCNGHDDDCDGFVDEGCRDTDKDGIADCLEIDRDGDGVLDDGGGNGQAGDTPCPSGQTNDCDDNCPLKANADQLDVDADLIGDVCDPDDDNDGVLDDGDGSQIIGDGLCTGGANQSCDDNCPLTKNPDQADLNYDSIGDACDPDDDNDGYPDADDNCPRVPNADQIDCDGDGIGKACDDDDDADAVPDSVDNCRCLTNPDQVDLDQDGKGDPCDPDLDGDGVPNETDGCPRVADASQEDRDHDGVGDACDPDRDGDGVAEDGDGSGTAGDEPCRGVAMGCDDNCPDHPNALQQDLDLDGAGDPCDPDKDGDGAKGIDAGGDDCNDWIAAIHPVVLEGQTAEGACQTCNGVDDDCDGVTDEGCYDTNLDGQPDCLTNDDDGDGEPDGVDNCPKDPNPDQADLDGDGKGDACDDDADGDGHLAEVDCDEQNPDTHPGADECCNGVDDDCNGVTDDGFVDTDGDGLADCVDPDDDDDGVLDDGDASAVNGDAPCTGGQRRDCDDNCPFLANASQADLDLDSLGDACDDDDDDDGVPDASDVCPRDTNPDQADLDGDALGDVCDPDDDGDGVGEEGGGDGLVGSQPCATGQTTGCDDNCPRTSNANQADLEGDGAGDACDPDDDNDGVPEDGDGSGVVGDRVCASGTTLGCDDSCPTIANPGQEDLDRDGLGDVCDPDQDGDGHVDQARGGDDCDDRDPSVYPGVPETQTAEGACVYCNEIDDDCDGSTDEGCYDTDGDGRPDCLVDDDDGDGVSDGSDNCQKIPNSDQADLDKDGLGDACDPDKDGDGFMAAGDCDDFAAGVHPGAYEACNGVDDNCNGSTDEGYDNTDGDAQADCVDPDDDDDGVLDDGGGDGVVGSQPCTTSPVGCDDNCRRTPNPGQIDLDGDGAGDLCDADDDNDGVPDEADNCPRTANTGQIDTDQDGQGDACDSDDDDDGVLDDGDGDGVIGSHPCTGGANQGCDDNCRTTKNTPQADFDGDGKGDVCDGDQDGDGDPDDTDCADRDPAIHHAALEVCDGIDNDCDGRVDAADGVDLLANDSRACENQTGVCAGAGKRAALCQNGAWLACDNAAYAANHAAFEPGNETRCDGLDNDCNGAADEDFSLVLLDGRTVTGVGLACGVGACVGGTTTCRSDNTGIRCSTEGAAKAEVCNGADDDCDGKTDAADAADLAVSDPAPCEKQAGVCSGSKKPAALCVSGSWQACANATYSAHSPFYQAGLELACDGRDNDCDGTVDDDFRWTGPDGTTVAGINATCGVGACAGGTTQCVSSGDATTCTTADKVAKEICNNKDDDCDGKADAADATDLLANDSHACENQKGVCAGASKPASLCKTGAWSPCDAAVYLAHAPAGYEAGSETRCDLLDNDCDGDADERAYDLCPVSTERCIAGSCQADDLLVPAGTFWMGCNATQDTQCQEDEKPYHQETTAAYRIDRTEVTMEMYAACVAAGKCSAVPDSQCDGGGTSTYGKVGKSQHPIICLTWTQGSAYCAWKGRRLCTVQEWEKAARGGCEIYGNCQNDSRKYPWGGQAPACSRAHYAEGGPGCGTDGSAPVGTRATGVSPYGAHDIAGNAWEWVQDLYTPSYSAETPAVTMAYHRERRGGGFTSCAEIRASNRDSYPEAGGRADGGVRCCKTP